MINNFILRSCLLSSILLASTEAWAPSSTKPTTLIKLTTPKSSAPIVSSYDPLNLSEPQHTDTSNLSSIAPLLAGGLVLGTPAAASAATAFAPNGVGAALAAYGHYISIFGLVACTVVERVLIKPNMSEEDENLAVFADIGLGVWGALMAYTGYLRASQYEKGFAFYSHEPIFWLKITLVAIYGAATFFNTTILIKRGIEKKNSGTYTPMSEELADRMTRLCNAELVALATIPATATVMARGIGYNDSIPWQAEAAFASLVFAGAGFKYIKEALDFETKPLEPSSAE